MLEARSHNQLKQLLQRTSSSWPHNLTLSRLVARSLRRRDSTLIHLDHGSEDFWWLGLLIPLGLENSDAVLVLSNRQRNRLINFVLPRLKPAGFRLAFWEGSNPPSEGQLWLIDHVGLIDAHQNGHLYSKQLIFPEAEFLCRRLRHALALKITLSDWDLLRRAHPSADSALVQLHHRLSTKLFAQATHAGAQVRMDCSEILALKDLIGVLGTSPAPWQSLLRTSSQSWASWAELDHKTLNWLWHLQPLEPLENLNELFQTHPVLFLTATSQNNLLLSEINSSGCVLDVNVSLGAPNLQDPISLFAPFRQPLPNTEIYAEYLLNQSRRLILGRSGLTILLLDDDQLRYQLTSGLAAEFGRRVVHEITAPESNGVVCCRWSWWLRHQDQLPSPEQLIIALLPLASLESPLMAARVESFKLQGRDWFRDLLLPEALRVLPRAVTPVRRCQGRVAILDGRLRSRSWGESILRTLEPWIPLNRLLPD